MTGLLKGIELYCRCAPIHFIGKLDRFYGSRYLLHVVILRASIIVTLVLILAAQRTKTGSRWSRGGKRSKALPQKG